MSWLESDLNRFAPILTLFLTFHAAISSAQAPDVAMHRAAAQASPDDAAAQRAYGMALLRGGDYAGAATALEAAARLQPRVQSAAFDAARPSFQGTDYRAAQRACRRVERLERNGIWAHICRARAFLVWNRSARAFDSLEAALALDARHYEALVTLGDAHRLRMQQGEAESAYERAIASDASRIEGHRGLGLLYLAAPNGMERAESHFRRALEIDQHDPETLFALARFESGAEEQRLLAHAVTVRPTWAQARVRLGELLLAAGDAAAAREHFEAAVENEENLAAGHCGLGRSLTTLEEHEAARTAIDRALEIVPNYAAAVLALAEHHRATGRTEPAFEQYRRAAGLAPADPSALLAAAELALERNRDVLAAGFLDRLLSRHADLAAALALYGDVMQIRAQRSEARSYYQRALRGSGPVDRARIEAALAELGL